MTEGEKKKLFKAIEKDDRRTIEAVLEKNPSEVDVYGSHNRNCRDKTPLMYALQCENFPLARWLIARGANVRARMSGGPGGPQSSVLALVAQFGHGLNPRQREWIEFAEELIALGADPSEALWPALLAYDKRDDKSEMIELMIAAGADPEYAIPAETIKNLVKINRRLYSEKVLKLMGVK